LAPSYLGGPTKLTVIGVLPMAWAVLMIAAARGHLKEVSAPPYRPTGGALATDLTFAKSRAAVRDFREQAARFRLWRIAARSDSASAVASS
jgi:hypothetical protein